MGYQIIDRKTGKVAQKNNYCGIYHGYCGAGTLIGDLTVDNNGNVLWLSSNHCWYNANKYYRVRWIMRNTKQLSKK